ncbi:MAG: VWA domain-containing protein [Pseudonocardia sp.]|nr:MAG: VWA domain-containing protein [Pseudonocardia sp.]
MQTRIEPETILTEDDVSDMVTALVTFASLCTASAVAVPVDRISLQLEALSLLDPTRRSDLYWSGKQTLCAGPADFDRYDSAFELCFGTHRRHSAAESDTDHTRALSDGTEIDDTREQPSDAIDLGVGGRSDRFEVLRQMDIATMTSADRDSLNQLLTELRPNIAPRHSRRYRSNRHGTVDVSKSVRRMLQRSEECNRLEFRTRRMRPRKLVMIVDVSGSMSPYADSLLRFAHAALQNSKSHSEVFTVGTRLTRVTNQFHRRDTFGALKDAGQEIPDWRGGTRLGDMLKAFLDRWGQRGVVRGAVAVICSDGWERGDPALLGAQMARLARLAHRVIWVNPHSGKDGYTSTTGGMVAALPHIDELVSGHTMDALTRLAEVIDRA